MKSKLRAMSLHGRLSPTLQQHFNNLVIALSDSEMERRAVVIMTWSVDVDVLFLQVLF